MPPYEITTDKSRMSVEAAHAFLSQAYWSQDVPLSVVQRAFENSLCFAAIAEGEQVGFARVVTDKATFAYLADVYVLPAHRGNGLSKRLVAAVQQHPELQGIRRFMLATRDAHRAGSSLKCDTAHLVRCRPNATSLLAPHRL